MDYAVCILCELDRLDLENKIAEMLCKGWRVVNAFHRDGKMYSWCALMVKECSNA